MPMSNISPVASRANRKTHGALTEGPESMRQALAENRMNDAIGFARETLRDSPHQHGVHEMLRYAKAGKYRSFECAKKRMARDIRVLWPEISAHTEGVAAAACLMATAHCIKEMHDALATGDMQSATFAVKRAYTVAKLADIHQSVPFAKLEKKLQWARSVQTSSKISFTFMSGFSTYWAWQAPVIQASAKDMNVSEATAALKGWQSLSDGVRRTYALLAFDRALG